MHTNLIGGTTGLNESCKIKRREAMVKVLSAVVAKSQ